MHAIGSCKVQQYLLFDCDVRDVDAAAGNHILMADSENDSDSYLLLAKSPRLANYDRQRSVKRLVGASAYKSTFQSPWTKKWPLRKATMEYNCAHSSRHT